LCSERQTLNKELPGSQEEGGPVTDEPTIDVKTGEALSQDEINKILTLCSNAFEEDYEPFLQTFTQPIHVVAKLGTKLVSHALWITRWLQVGDSPLLCTAYVEAVATERSYRGRGYATLVMARLGQEIQSYEIGALSPADTSLYTRLGWEYWQGPLYARKEGRLIPIPGETAMILRTSKTPVLNTHAPLSIEWREMEVW
jgi:aminoglycoside 2'-N-acetyltransferase I